MRRTALATIFTAAVAVACGAGTKEKVAKATLPNMSAEERRESFEATARVLDEHPRLVDEFYAVARRHPPTMNRFLANTTRDLREPELAKRTAERLVQHPESLEQTLETTTDLVLQKKAARTAMSQAIASRAEATVDVLTDHPDAMARVLTAALAALEKKPAARTATVAAVRKNRGRIVALVKNDPELMKELTEELLRELVEDRPVLEKLLSAAGIIDVNER